MTLLLYQFAGRFGDHRTRCSVLSSASLFYYAWWNINYVPIMLGSIVINFLIGKKVQPKQGKMWMLMGIVLNLALLGYFKYVGFFLENVAFVFGKSFSMENILLPLGISFFTFQQISYLIDRYSGMSRDDGLLVYTTFVLFFPQLIAGPIVRYWDMAPQLLKVGELGLRFVNLNRGFYLFAIGLFKKVWVADSIAPYVDTGYLAIESGHIPTFFESWFVALAYPLQIYFDFSGYSDMAFALALMFGLTIPVNFLSPYKATNMSDFWQRWHISLTQCFQRYLFNPIAMSLRHYKSVWVKIYLPYLLTMSLIGLWHGAGWNFVIWGALHGLFLAIAYHWKTKRWQGLPKPLAWVWNCFLLMFVFVFFRAVDLESATELIKGMFAMNGVVLPKVLEGLVDMPLFSYSYYLMPCFYEYRTYEPILPCVLAGLLALLAPNSQELLKRYQSSCGNLCVSSGLILMSLFAINEVTTFLYYQF